MHACAHARTFNVPFSAIVPSAITLCLVTDHRSLASSTHYISTRSASYLPILRDITANAILPIHKFEVASTRQAASGLSTEHDPRRVASLSSQVGTDNARENSQTTPVDELSTPL